MINGPTPAVYCPRCQAAYPFGPEHYRLERPRRPRRGVVLLVHRYCGGGRYALAHVAEAAGITPAT